MATGVASNKGASLGYVLGSLNGLNSLGLCSINLVINSREDPMKGNIPSGVLDVFFS